MSDLNGAIGTAQVDRLDGFNERRRETSEHLLTELDNLDWLEPATVRNYVDHAYFWAPFEVQEDKIGMTGKKVWAELRERGVETRHRYNMPLYDQPVFADHRGFNSEFPWSANPNEHDYDLSLPNVENVVGSMIGLPNHPGLENEDIEYVIETIRAFNPKDS